MSTRKDEDSGDYADRAMRSIYDADEEKKEEKKKEEEKKVKK